MLSRTRKRSLKKAFTLLELIVVIVILGILAALAIPTFARVITRARERTAEAAAEAFGREALALAAFRGDGSGVTLADLNDAKADTDGAVDFTGTLVDGKLRVTVGSGTSAVNVDLAFTGNTVDGAVASSAAPGSGTTTPTTPLPASTLYSNAGYVVLGSAPAGSFATAPYDIEIRSLTGSLPSGKSWEVRPYSPNESFTARYRMGDYVAGSEPWAPNWTALSGQTLDSYGIGTTNYSNATGAYLNVASHVGVQVREAGTSTVHTLIMTHEATGKGHLFVDGQEVRFGSAQAAAPGPVNITKVGLDCDPPATSSFPSQFCGLKLTETNRSGSFHYQKSVTPDGDRTYYAGESWTWDSTVAEGYNSNHGISLHVDTAATAAGRSQFVQVRVRDDAGAAWKNLVVEIKADRTLVATLDGVSVPTS
jgi:prepilin-type N-terminal cleavage/methylation domain-containing protein